MARPSIISSGLILALISSSQALPNLDGSRHLWYAQPAQDWETGALPIGCGRLGASVFGGAATEVLTITEDTIWSGPLQDRVPADGLAALPRVRDLLLAGDITAAGQLVLGQMTPAQASEREFSYFGDLKVAFGHDEPQGYRRWLDTRQGDAGVEYTFEGVEYTREYIASYPASVLAARFSASKGGALALNASFDRLEHVLSNSASVEDGVGSITMSGSSGQALADNPILFTGQARFVAPGATIQVYGSTLQIFGASVVDVFFDAETNYRYPDPTVLQSKIDSRLSAAMSQGFPRVREEALADAGSLLGRAAIDLGPSPDGLASLPTDRRVTNARTDTRDIQLTTLTWNYGRHLLVGASRKTPGEPGMPANLQGVWNNKTTAAWGGKFTININTEMNYWPAGTTNLLDTHDPLFDLMLAAQPRGQDMARRLYGCAGTVFHHNLDLWGDPAPTDNYTSSTMWPMGAAWLAQHMMDHWRFTGDAAFLARTAYPFLVDVANFYHCYTFEWGGHRVTGPSLSPENSFVTPDGMSVAGSVEPMDMAVEMDNQLMRDVMAGVLEAAGELGLADTDADVVAARRFLPLIRPPQIGSLGQILEWRYEYQEKAKGHRHLSPLYGNHPSAQFSPLVNATLASAARVLLDRRVDGGGGSTGWSRAWLINQYARQFSGADAWAHVVQWFAQYPTTNLWNTDSGSGFQIDGNYGFTSAVTEMLLQSHAGVVHILPALPAAAVPAGSASGLLARGGFEVDVAWRDGVLETATVRSTLGRQLALRVQDGHAFSVNGKTYGGPIQTTKGARYVIILN